MYFILWISILPQFWNFSYFAAGTMELLELLCLSTLVKAKFSVKVKSLHDWCPLHHILPIHDPIDVRFSNLSKVTSVPSADNEWYFNTTQNIYQVSYPHALRPQSKVPIGGN